MHSIRFKISAITIAAILVSILAVLVTVIATVGEESDRNATQNLALLCDNTCLSLNEYFDSIEQSVEMAASITADSLDSVALVEGGVAGKFAAHGHKRRRCRAWRCSYRRGPEKEK